MNEIVDDTVMFMEHHLTRFKNVEISVEKNRICQRFMLIRFMFSRQW